MAITEGTDICIYNGASSVMLRSVDCNPFSHLTLTLRTEMCTPYLFLHFGDLRNKQQSSKNSFCFSSPISLFTLLETHMQYTVQGQTCPIDPECDFTSTV